MSMLNRLMGLIAAIAYGLRRSRIGFLRLHSAAIAIGLLGAAYAAFSGWRNGFTLAHVSNIAVCVGAVGVLLWTDARRYVVFRTRGDLATGDKGELAPGQKLFLRGSGAFEVSKMRRYLVEVPVVFWATELREHIVAAKVRALNILGVGVPSVERGWWYVFLEPRRVVEIDGGELFFGLRRRPAVRVVFEGKRGREALHLSCDSLEQLDIVLSELRAKVAAARAQARG
jgi:hypothetical protein